MLRKRKISFTIWITNIIIIIRSRSLKNIWIIKGRIKRNVLRNVKRIKKNIKRIRRTKEKIERIIRIRILKKIYSVFKLIRLYIFTLIINVRISKIII